MAFKQKIISFWYKNYAYIIFLSVVILAHSTVRIYNDDEYFTKALDNSTLIEFVCFRYEVWSSRVIIEFLLALLARTPILWAVLDIFVFFVLGNSLIRLLSLDKKEDVHSRALVLGCCFLIPARAYNGAGWIATTLNYLWPCALALFSMVPDKKLLCKEKVHKWQFVLSIPALVIAANMELVCAFLLAIMLLFTAIYFVKTKKVNLYFALKILLLLLMMIFIFTCPGNYVRLAGETQTWFPEFADLTLFQKLKLGLTSTLYQFIFDPNLLFLCLTFLLFAAVLAKRGKAMLCAAAFMPLLCGVGNIVLKLFSKMERLVLFDLVPGLQILFSLFICGVILFLIGYLFEKRYACILIYVLSVGFATRMAMALSPTIHVSDVRTFWPMMIAMIFCMGGLMKLLVHAQYRYRNVIFLIIGGIETFAALDFCGFGIIETGKNFC